MLGYVYPAYRTFKVVQLPATRANDTLLRKWCCYWCLIAALTAVQPLLDTFLFWVRHERCGSLLLTELVLALGTLLSMLPLRPTKWVLAPWQVARQPPVRQPMPAWPALTSQPQLPCCRSPSTTRPSWRWPSTCGPTVRVAALSRLPLPP